MQMKRILVTGANGQLGTSLKEQTRQYDKFVYIYLDINDLDLTNESQVRLFFDQTKIDYVINCAAYTAVDHAETERDLAFIVNTESTGVLAAVCKENGTKFLHISTDYVFNGNAIAPYKEDDPTDPQSVYGESKREGEILAFRFNPDSIVIRTSWVYSEFGKNFVKTMIRLLHEQKSIRVVNDQWGSPTYAFDLAECIMQIISSEKFIPGIYQFSNEGAINWFQFAEAIKEILDSTCAINPIPSSEYPTPAKRPAYSVMSKDKIMTLYDVKLIPWKKSLKACIKLLTKES